MLHESTQTLESNSIAKPKGWVLNDLIETRAPGVKSAKHDDRIKEKKLLGSYARFPHKPL
jgi:hypothetical protein